MEHGWAKRLLEGLCPPSLTRRRPVSRSLLGLTGAQRLPRCFRGHGHCRAHTGTSRGVFRAGQEGRRTDWEGTDRELSGARQMCARKHTCSGDGAAVRNGCWDVCLGRQPGTLRQPLSRGPCRPSHPEAAPGVQYMEAWGPLTSTALRPTILPRGFELAEGPRSASGEAVCLT